MCPENNGMHAVKYNVQFQASSEYLEHSTHSYVFFH